MGSGRRAYRPKNHGQGRTPMNRPYSNDDLRILLGAHPEPLAGVEETDDEWWLGRLSVNKKCPEFRSGYSHSLQPESKFRKQWFEFRDGRKGWVAIFQLFDPASPNPAPPEYLAGWVMADREPDLDKWIEFLNAEIRDRLIQAQRVDG